MALRSSVFCLQTVKIANDFLGNAGQPSGGRSRGLGFLSSNQGQFARVELVAAAVRALVHFHPAFGAKEVPVEFHARATWTVALAG